MKPYSKYKPMVGDRFSYEGRVYELSGGNNDYWMARDIITNLLALRIRHENWERAKELFDDYYPTIRDEHLDEELFKI